MYVYYVAVRLCTVIPQCRALRFTDCKITVFLSSLNDILGLRTSKNVKYLAQR